MSLLADLILVLHFGIVLFLAGGFLLIAAGGPLRWGWVRNRRFRWLHLGLMGFITFESLIGMACPLTVWEERLRETAGQEGYAGDFVSHWVGRLLFHDLPSSFFIALYVAFFLAILAAWFLFPPEPLREE